MCRQGDGGEGITACSVSRPHYFETISKLSFQLSLESRWGGCRHWSGFSACAENDNIPAEVPQEVGVAEASNLPNLRCVSVCSKIGSENLA